VVSVARERGGTQFDPALVDLLAAEALALSEVPGLATSLGLSLARPARRLCGQVMTAADACTVRKRHFRVLRDGGPALSAQLSCPQGVPVDTAADVRLLGLDRRPPRVLEGPGLTTYAAVRARRRCGARRARLPAGLVGPLLLRVAGANVLAVGRGLRMGAGCQARRVAGSAGRLRSEAVG
jgi:hypothetical protein